MGQRDERAQAEPLEPKRLTWGRHSVLLLERCASTNDEAWRCLEAAPAALPSAIVAHQQTAGRGRRGRSWWSEPGQVLMLSVPLRPQIPLSEASSLALLSAVAVADVCQSYGVRPWLKWPNDVRWGSGKLAGILCEARSRATDWSAVIGVGLNLRRPAAGWPLEVPGVSLEEAQAQGDLRVEAVGARLIEALEQRLASASLGWAPILRAFEALSPPAGTRFTQAGREGTYVGLSADGALRLRDDAGQIQEIRTGEVQVVGEGPPEE